jgi:NDP-sugar pyrophosphorylase family protein
MRPIRLELAEPSATLCVRSTRKVPVIALNGDSFAPFRVDALVSALNGGAEISLGAVEVDDAARFGVAGTRLCVDD